MLDKLIAGAMQGMTGPAQAGGNPLMDIIGTLLSNGGPNGGLAGLVQQFQQAGLGQQIGSWISTGENMPITAEQLTKVFGGGQLQQMAQSVGLDGGQLSEQLSQMLPQVVDQLTPKGELPRGGFEDALGMLSSLMKR